MIKLKWFHSFVKNKLLTLGKVWKQFMKVAATKIHTIKYSDLQQKQFIEYFFPFGSLLSYV